MNIWWTKPAQSGLCDRLLDLAHVLAYARVLRHGINLEWPDFQAKSIDCAHRGIDIQLPNILEHIRFPRDVAFLGEGKLKFEVYVGGEGNADLFHQRHLDGVCPLEEYKQAIRSVADDFGFCDAINGFLETIPDRFAAFHIRRGDKVRDQESDGFFIHHSELATLNALTYKALDACQEATIFFCGDEDRKIDEFANYARGLGKHVFVVPPMEKWRTTYYDLAVMSKSRSVYTSQRYSAFGRFAALLGNVPWRAAFQEQ